MAALLIRSIASAALSVLILSGCTPTRYVPGETVRTEYAGNDYAELMAVVKSLTERLSIKERQVDSLMQSRNERLVLSDKGDTLRHDRETIVYRSTHREKELEKIVESQKDSIEALRQRLESVKSDSIRVPYPVERKLSRWERAKMDFGGFAMGGFVIALCIAVAWLIKKFRR